jgi:hypothetical protein
MTWRIRHALVAAAAALTVGLGSAASAETITGLRPADPQPTAEQLAPGLAVEYTYAMMNHVDEMKGRKFESGQPIMHLDWVMGYGIVLTSKAHEGVGAIITGFLRFDKPGTYGFNVTSNDGVRVEIGGQLVHEDPGVHSDRTSDRIDLKVEQPGWYPLKIMYFQKRYTATLVVRWIGPGETGKLTPVKGAVLAHLK